MAHRAQLCATMRVVRGLVRPCVPNDRVIACRGGGSNFGPIALERWTLNGPARWILAGANALDPLRGLGCRPALARELWPAMNGKWIVLAALGRGCLSA